jgi:hypothetical protein
VLSLIDPTGLLSLAATWYFGVWIDASFVKTHSRRAETEADDTGVRVRQCLSAQQSKRKTHAARREAGCA